MSHNIENLFKNRSHNHTFNLIDIDSRHHHHHHNHSREHSHHEQSAQDHDHIVLKLFSTLASEGHDHEDQRYTSHNAIDKHLIPEINATLDNTQHRSIKYVINYTSFDYEDQSDHVPTPPPQTFLSYLS